MDEIVDFEASTALTDAQKIALRLHRAYLTHPAGLGGDVRGQALAEFSPAQIVELGFKFFWWSTNRASVTLGDDAPHDTERVITFHYDADGRYVVHESRA